MYLLYRKEFNYNLSLIKNYRKLGLLPRIYRIQSNTIFGLFFTTRSSAVFHPQVHLRYLKLLFPRRGEQCPVVEFSNMGYSPPKCSCNGNQTNIQVNHAYSYLNVYMPRPMPRVLTDSLTHAISHVWKTVLKTKICVCLWTTL